MDAGLQNLMRDGLKLMAVNPAPRATHLIESATRAHTQDGYTSYPALCASFEAVIRDLCQQLETLTGENATPAKDCQFTRVNLWGAQVLVEHEHDPGDKEDGWDECWPIRAAFINGNWAKAKDMPEEVQEALHEAVKNVSEGFRLGFIPPHSRRLLLEEVCPAPAIPSLRSAT